MIGGNLVVEGVPGNPHPHHHHHHHPHRHALVAGAGHPIHGFNAIHHLSPNTVTSASHLMSATTFAENSFLKAAAAAANGSLLPSPNEFLRPLPKPAPIVAARYNGVTNNLNGSIKSRHTSKYSDVADVPGPVNLVHQLKEPASSPDSAHAGPGYSIYSSPRLYPSPGPSSYSHFPPPPPPPPPPSIQSGPYGSLYQPNPFTPMLQRDNRSTHLLQLQQYPDSNTPILKSPPTQTAPTSSAAAVVTSTASVKSVFETPAPPSPSTSEAHNHRAEKRPFKVPSGKEGSLKHRLLSRPADTRVPKKVLSAARSNSSNSSSSSSSSTTTLLTPATVSSTQPPASHSNGVATGRASPTESSPSLPLPHLPPQVAMTTTMTTTTAVSNSHCVTSAVCGNNGTVSNNFSRGSLIQLANGELKKIEDMQTEDFLSSAEKSSTMRIDPSTVVRIVENKNGKGPAEFATLTLSYGEQRHQVDYETPVEHPYFVFQHGWSSCSPAKTFALFGLQCRQLEVGDVCVSLSRRLSQPNGSQTARKSSAASRLRQEERAIPAPGALRSDHQSSGSARMDAAHGATGSGGDNGSTLSYKKNDLRIDNCNENNGLRLTHANGDSSIDSKCSTANSNSTNSNSRRNITYIGNPRIKGFTLNGADDGMKFKEEPVITGTNFTLNLTNRHGVDDEGKKYEKLENDTNNNSNNMSDKYAGLSSKKKRRWSAPDQISDEYQNSPLSSPQSMSSALSSTSSVGSDVAVALSARNV